MILLRTILFTIFVPGFMTGLLPYLLVRFWPEFLNFPPGALGWLGLIPLVAGIAIYLTCAWELTFVGLGTPNAFDAPRNFVKTGLYRRVRNPMYIGIILAILGQSVLYGSGVIAIAAAVFWLVVHLFIVLYEEKHLAKKFGAQYEEFLRTVPRWLPRKPKYRA